MEITAIHVHTQCDKGTVHFAQFMWETLLDLANYPNKIKLTVHCMGPSAEARVTGWRGQVQTMITPCKRGDPLIGSIGHGACVNEALSMTNDGDIHVIADSDTVVLAKGWDDYLRIKLLSEKIDIVGSTYEEPGGICSGTSKSQMYKKIPSVTWFAVAPRHDWRGLDALPNKDHHVAITTIELSDIYNLPHGQGYTILCDAGWRIPQYLHDHGLKYEGWKQLKPTVGAVLLNGLSTYHEEYHVNDVPFLVHHRGSMRHAYRRDKISVQFYAAVDQYLIGEKLQAPRFDYSNGTVPIPVAAPEKPVAKKVTTPEDHVPRGAEWLKVSFNGKAIFARQQANRKAPLALNFEKPGVDRIGHVRIEGSIEFDYKIKLPATTQEQYLITVRNATTSPILLNGGVGNDIAVPAGQTWFVLVDIDGAQYVG